MSEFIQEVALFEGEKTGGTSRGGGQRAQQTNRRRGLRARIGGVVQRAVNAVRRRRNR